MAVWSTNTLRNVRTSQNAVNAKRSLRASGQHVPANVHASRSVKRPSPVHTVVCCAINAYVNVSFVHSWLKNRKSWKCLADHRNFLPLRNERTDTTMDDYVFFYSPNLMMKMEIEILKNWIKKETKKKKKKRRPICFPFDGNVDFYSFPLSQ